MWDHQWDAIKCFCGDYSVYKCEDTSTFWVLVFTFGYVFSFGIGAIILKVKGSNTVANLNALLFPLSSMALWIRPIVGSHGQDPVWWVGAALVVITIGNYLFECSDTDNDTWFSRKIRGTCFDTTIIDSEHIFSCCKKRKSSELTAGLTSNTYGGTDIA